MAALVPMLVLTLAAPLSYACPAGLFVSELHPDPTGPRKGMRLFAKSGRTWRSLAVQVDPVDDDGHLIFFSNDHFHGKDLAATDLMTFRSDQLGEKIKPGDPKLPCTGPQVWEIKDRDKGLFGYLTSCGFQASPQALPQQVAFDKKGHRLESSLYRYLFNPDNYMQFQSIAFRTPSGGYETVALDSRLMIRADVRNFFTMNFDSTEIESRLEDSRLGPVGNLARLSFLLRILFFKIKMSLSTDVAFFDDAGHIPMMVNIPVNAYDYLHPQSGILYSWIPTPGMAAAPQFVEMPRLDTKLVAKGHKELAKTGAKYCEGRRCYYRFGTELSGQRLSMDFKIEQKLIEKGFFPVFVDDVAKYQEEMGWDIDIPEKQKRIGMYFEVSGLPEGGHPWEFWLRMGGHGAGPSACPAPIEHGKADVSVLK